MSGWLPKSPKARRRLYLVAAIAPVLGLAVGLTLWGLSDSISFFYTPAQVAEAKPPVEKGARSTRWPTVLAGAPISTASISRT